MTSIELDAKPLSRKSPFKLLYIQVLAAIILGAILGLYARIMQTPSGRRSSAMALYVS